MFSRSPVPEENPLKPAAGPGFQPNGPQSRATPNAGRDPFAAASVMTGSTIGTDLTILGEKITIISQHQLQIDGDVRGDVNGKRVLIGQEGSVEGTVTAEAVEVRGGLRGAIRARSVTLQPTARVEGDIHHETLSIAEGAEFDGRVRRPKDMSELNPNLDPNQVPANISSSSYSLSEAGT